MAFRFALQSLLALRQSQEGQEEALLLNANRKVDAVRREIESCQEYLRHLNLLRAQSLNSGMSGAELNFDLLCEAAIRDRKRALEEQLVAVEKGRDQQFEVFRQARMRREILESLRDRQFRQYEIERDRRQQRSLDDAFLMRREFLRRERR